MSRFSRCVALAAVAVATSCGSVNLSAADGGQGVITLSAKDLAESFEARKVLLDNEGKKLALDPRVFKFGNEKQGVVTTDTIDLGERDGIIGTDARVTAAVLEVGADVPAGAAVVVETRTGDNILDTTSWSKWEKLDGLKGGLKTLAGRYVQVRMTLKSTSADKLPALTSLVLTPTVVPNPREPWPPVKVADAKVQKIVRSTIDFQYERPDHPEILKFRRAARLDDVVKGAKDDFDKLVKLMDWTGGCTNVRGTNHEHKNGAYAWDINCVWGVVDGKPSVYGHCMSYSEVLVHAAIAMGYVGARHMNMEGFREMTHEVCDIWVPSLGKWVYFDPSLTNTYYDLKTKTPLNLIEMHKVVVDNFVPEGKDTNWLRTRDNAEAKALVRKIGGQKVIGSRLGPSRYGDPMPADYDWGWYHGYLAAGAVQMTPRNDFYTNPKAVSRGFGNAPGYSNWPNWVDSKTPPSRGAHNWFTRMRDFYWTLDQASVNLVRTNGDTLRVELGQSMPFFKAYALKVDGVEVKDVKSPFEWKLKAGANKLEVAPVDEFGKTGLASTVTLELAR